MVRRRFIRQFLAFAVAASAYAAATFTNPLLPNGPDPWVIYDNGYYYYLNTTGKNITIRKTQDITDLRDADKKVIWAPPPAGPYSQQVWAPELHKLNGVWYVYFAADDGKDTDHRLYVLKDNSPDPMSDDWTLLGPVEGLQNYWGIDPTVFEEKGHNYIVWSGWPRGGHPKQQYLYVAELKTPSEVRGKRVLISKPSYDWELREAEINEGPEILKHDSKIFLIYSANGCWTDYYSLGMLVASEGSNLLKRSSWHKVRHPMLTTSPEAHAFGPGHNTFFKSPDGTQDWILYHANPGPNEGCDGQRSPRAQPFTWDARGMPDFGAPVPLEKSLAKPSGTPNGAGQ